MDYTLFLTIRNLKSVELNGSYGIEGQSNNVYVMSRCNRPNKDFKYCCQENYAKDKISMKCYLEKAYLFSNSIKENKFLCYWKNWCMVIHESSKNCPADNNSSFSCHVGFVGCEKCYAWNSFKQKFSAMVLWGNGMVVRGAKTWCGENMLNHVAVAVFSSFWLGY